MKKAQYNRLLSLLKMQAESRNKRQQLNIAAYVINQLIDKKIDLNIEIDQNAVYLQRGTDRSPVIIAHLDQVHRVHDRYEIHKSQNTLFAFDGKKQVGTGGDDKNGVFIGLECMLKFKNMKFVMYFDEEIGCVGSKGCTNTKFYQNVSFLIQADRKGKTDFISQTNGYIIQSDEFKRKAKEIYSTFGYKDATGTMTDVGEIANKYNLCGVNISCGYYSAHSDKEIILLSELENALKMTFALIEGMKVKRWRHKARRPQPSKPAYRYSPAKYGKRYTAPEQLHECPECKSLNISRYGYNAVKCNNCRSITYNAEIVNTFEPQTSIQEYYDNRIAEERQKLLNAMEKHNLNIETVTDNQIIETMKIDESFSNTAKEIERLEEKKKKSREMENSWQTW